MTLLALILCIIPHDEPLVDACELVEINHLYTTGDVPPKVQFTQVIWWEACDDGTVYRVVSWRLVKCPTMRPFRYGGSWRVVWLDGGEYGVLRRVDSRFFRETFTFYDPELQDRQRHPKEQRRELSRHKDPAPIRYGIPTPAIPDEPPAIPEVTP